MTVTVKTNSIAHLQKRALFLIIQQHIWIFAPKWPGVCGSWTVAGPIKNKQKRNCALMKKDIVITVWRLTIEVCPWELSVARKSLEEKLSRSPKLDGYKVAKFGVHLVGETHTFGIKKPYMYLFCNNSFRFARNSW